MRKKPTSYNSPECSSRRTFLMLPEQIIRDILTFFDATELSLKCSLLSKRFYRESETVAGLILGLLSTKYSWIRALLNDKYDHEMFINDGSDTVSIEYYDINSSNDNYTRKSKDRGSIGSNSNSSNNSSGSNIDNDNMITRSKAINTARSTTSIPGIEDSILRKAERNMSSNIYVLHMLTSPSILVVGGNSEPKRVDLYDVINNRWIQYNETHVGREVFFEVLWFQGFVYVFCGIHHSSYGSVERLNPLTRIWTEVASLPCKLAATVGAVLHGKLYIVGGYVWHLAEYSDAVFVYDTGSGASRDSGRYGEDISKNSLNIKLKKVKNRRKKSIDVTDNNDDARSNGNTTSAKKNTDNRQRDSWALLPSRLLIGRSSHACVAYQEKLWIAGGILDGTDFEGTDLVEIFDPIIGHWVSGPNLTVNRFRLRLFVVDDVLYAVGGDRDDRGRLVVQTIERLKEDGLSWVHVARFPVERRGFLSSLTGGIIYLIGGRTADIPLKTWDAFDVKQGLWYSEEIQEEIGDKQEMMKKRCLLDLPNQQINNKKGVMNGIGNSVENAGNNVCTSEVNNINNDDNVDENHRHNCNKEINIPPSVRIVNNTPNGIIVFNSDSDAVTDEIYEGKSKTEKDINSKKSKENISHLEELQSMVEFKMKLSSMNMNLNRSGGVVGGRAVTAPAEGVYW